MLQTRPYIVKNELLKNITVLFANMITICESMNGCAEQYRCATLLYLLSILAHEYNIIIDCGVGSPGHVREVVSIALGEDRKSVDLSQ